MTDWSSTVFSEPEPQGHETALRPPTLAPLGAGSRAAAPSGSENTWTLAERLAAELADTIERERMSRGQL